MLLVGFILFLIRALFFLDPDFGWHLQSGSHILSFGIPKFDLFSYTMPSFEFINHEWLFDVLISTTNRLTGQYGLVILFASFGVLIIINLITKNKIQYLNGIIILLVISSIEPLFGVSPRVISWLLFTILLKIVLYLNIFNKRWWIVPLFMILWTNLHGSFILGLGILGIIFIVRSLNKRKLKIKELIVFLSSLIFTLINPYGYNLWQIVYSTISDPLQNKRIVEWLPTILALNHLTFLVFFIFSLSTYFLVKYRKKFKIEVQILNLIFFIFGLLAIRNMYYWILFAILIISNGVSYFYNDLKKNKESQKRLITSLKYIFWGALIIFTIQYVTTSYNLTKSFNEKGYYPKDAVIYLTKNVPDGQIFSDYTWGGYLVWKLPQKKTFINGLMPVWKNPNAPANESKDAMSDYLDILNSGNYKEQFAKYNIHTVLFDNNNKMFNLLKKNLIRDNWKEVYKYKNAVIYQKY